MFELNPIRPSSNPQQASRDGSEIELQSDGSYIQWRYKGFRKWFNLISLKELKGSAGATGNIGKKGDKGETGARGSDGSHGSIDQRGLIGGKGDQGERGLPGIEGPEGRKIDLRKTTTHIQWKYTGDSLWVDLVPLDQLKGDKGDKGSPGVEGSPGERGEKGIKGEDGDRGGTGPQGSPGPVGPIGPEGPPGSGGATNTFESVSKNIRSWDAVLGYTDDQLTTITYTLAAEIIIKTFNYTIDKLTSLVLSGDTPASIELTKTLSYTGDQLTGATYS